MHTGFTVINYMTEVEVHLHLPDSDQHPPLVTFARQGSSVALFMGYLYYQHELLAQLEADCSREVQRGCTTNAAALALSIYRSLGPASLERLEGDFAFVIWDAEQRHFVSMRDPLGGYPLFWTMQAGTIAFSTSIWALLHRTSQRSLNMEYFADLLMTPVTRCEGASESCAYAEIHRVLPGTIATLKISPLRVETRRYWHWLTQSQDPGTNSIAELAERSRSLLHAAVRERLLYGCTLAHLSGGMDSTSIALIAQEEIRSGAGEAPLHTFSLVYNRLPILAQERPYIEEVIQRTPHIVAHQLTGDDLLDFDGFRDPPPHEEPYAGLGRLVIDSASVDLAAQIGASTVLTGLGADEIYDTLPFYLTDVLRQGHLWKAWQEACKWAHALNCNPWGVLLPFGFAHLAPPWLVRHLARRRCWRSLRLNQQTDWTVPPWILPDFARHYALLDRGIDHAYHWHGLCRKTGVAMVLDAIEDLPGDVLRWSVAAPRGIAYAHPFLDLRLLCFGIGMLGRLQPEPGKMKPVLAEAMHHTLPESIRERRRKGHFNEVYYLGLARNLQRLKSMVQQAPLERLQIFDKDVLLSCLQQAGISDANVRQLHGLNCTLAIIQWLSKEQEWQQEANTPSQIIHISCAE